MQEEIAQLSETYLDATINLIVEIRRHELLFLDNSIDEQTLPDVEEPYRAGSGNFWITLVDGNVIGAVGLVDLGVDTEYDLAWFNLGGLYWNSGKLAEAKVTWKIATTRFPDHPLTENLRCTQPSIFVDDP